MLVQMCFFSICVTVPLLRTLDKRTLKQVLKLYSIIWLHPCIMPAARRHS